jgi:hypothetical protein
MKRFILTSMLALLLTCGSVAVSAQSHVGAQISAVEEVSTIKPIAGGVEISSNDDASRRYYVFSITGQTVKSGEVSGNAVVELPRGCYIVKCGGVSKKIVVK